MYSKMLSEMVLIVLSMRMVKVMLGRMMFKLKGSMLDVSALMMQSFFLKML